MYGKILSTAQADIAAGANSTFGSHTISPGAVYMLTAGQNGTVTNIKHLEVELPDGASAPIIWNWESGPFFFVGDQNYTTIQVNNPASGTPVAVSLSVLK